MFNQTLAHIINSGKHRSTTRIFIRYTPRLFRLIKLLIKYNLASVGLIKKKLNPRHLYYAFATKGTLHQSAREFLIISKKNHRIFISYKALQLLILKLGASILFLETPFGVITHIDALKKRIGGCILSCLLL